VTGEETSSPFQRVLRDLLNGCECACHTGIGANTACEHCYLLVVYSSTSVTALTPVFPTEAGRDARAT
jgi:hypothetical protein